MIIRYKTRGAISLTSCPFGIKITGTKLKGIIVNRVGSTACHDCEYHIRQGRFLWWKYVVCCKDKEKST